MNIAEKDLAYLDFNGLPSHIKESLEDYDFFTATQVTKELWLSHKLIDITILVCILLNAI